MPGQACRLRTEVHEYGLLIHNGEDGYAGSHVVIKYCPWCGSDLGANHSYAWFAELDARGLEPGDDLPQN